ncbi:MAG: UDP-N-acetylmuramate dehydrogenase [Spirochaetota bacterium]
MKANIETDKPLRQYTTIKTGGPAEFFSTPEDVEELQELLKWAAEHQHNVTPIGGGSNVLIAEEGLKGLVIDSRKLKRITQRGRLLTAATGNALEKTVTTAAEHGASGLEYFSGLPGTVGGAVYGNAGCFGHEISQCLAWVDYLESDGSFHRIFHDEMEFGYRDSPFKHRRWFITEVCFELIPTMPLSVSEAAKRFRQRRRDMGQYRNPSMGSIFKNPTDPKTGAQLSAGSLIEDSGLLGREKGGAQIASYHGNFIINPAGKASSSDIYALILYIQDVIRKNHGINLELEIQLLGSF